MLKTTLQTPTLLSAVTLAILFSGGLLFTTTNTVQAAEMSTKGLHDQVKFDISAGSLSSVLNQFGQQADILLTYSPELTQGLQSQGLRGEYSVEAGLTQLLKSTSLTVQKQADKSFLITDTGSTSALLPVVTVTGQQTVISPYAPLAGYAAVRSTSATKGSADLLDTPQSVSVITQAMTHVMTGSVSAVLMPNHKFTEMVYCNRPVFTVCHGLIITHWNGSKCSVALVQCFMGRRSRVVW